jgi:gliding motility-associated-like protein
MNDTTICEGDVIQLKLTSDALSYSWVPAEQVGGSEIPNPFATTSTTTSYKVTGRIGGCTAIDEVLVTTVPYPKASAGIDTAICHKSSVQLMASANGSSVIWSPSSSLSNASVLNPIARPSQTTTYTFSVFDNKGCPKPGKDSIVVTVLPPIIPFAGRDTAAVVGQPLQLNATGGVRYKWSPSFALSADNVANPIATYTYAAEDNLYRVNVYNEAGCVETATVVVKVFSTGPSVFVPTAFTPNRDGKNDKVSPVVVGMKRFEYFHIYNRWGQLVYGTSTIGAGWDGFVKGRVQGTETFIWVVKALDYNDKPYFQKGTVTLIH